MKRIYLSFFLCVALYGNETATDGVILEGVTATDNVEQVKEKKVSETKITSDRLKKQQISDSKDLVKYETGITVVETGRMGSSGYAVRGVDENRVAITIDGLRQSETLSSQGFKELFESYGNFNNTRNGVEIENVKLATITKGADSIKTGSGALGGSVMFETKDARDYLADKDYHFGFKNGYQSMNSQNLRSVTAAAKFKWFDILLINTKRSGHEIENYYYDIYKNAQEDRAHIGKTREKADPYNITRTSNLVKIGFQPSDEHRFSVTVDDSKLRSKGEDLSYTLRVSYRTDTEIYGQRQNDDMSHRKNVQYAYENFVQTPLWDSFKFSYSTQKIKNKARTDEYCNGPKCKNIKNPANLKLDTQGDVNKVVDEYGGDIEPLTRSGFSGYRLEGIKDSKGKEYKNSLAGDFYVRDYSADSVFLDCSKIDCSKKFRVFNRDTGKMEDRSINISQMSDGTKYGTINNGSRVNNLGFAFPYSEGFESNAWNDRDLNTNTKQFNLDFEKEFELLNTEHYVKYGTLHDKTEKSMVDQDGFGAANVQWWQDMFFGKDLNGNPNKNRWIPPSLSPRNSTTGATSYLIPVITKTNAFYIGDEIKFTEWLGADISYRYDKVKHKPNYILGKSPQIPRGLIAGSMIPLPGDPHTDSAFNSCRYDSPCGIANLKANLALLLQTKSFTGNSYSFGLNFDPLEWLRVQLKYSKGFRVPTSDEMYMTFKHPNFSIRPNTNLKAEIAKTQEAAVTFYKNQSFFTFNVFKTDYDNFIDLVYLGFRDTVESGLSYPFWQSQNRDEAKVTGFEINSLLQLEEIHPKLRGFRVGYKLTHQKGRMNKNIPMNAIQPTTAVYNLGYSTQNDKYGIDLFITDVAAKKRADTYNMYWENQKAEGRIVQGKPVTDSTLAWRSGDYTIFDLIAYARPTKNFSFGLGVYNITDKAYLTWDSARSIRAFGTMNLIDQNTGLGIKRFYAPGRNFRFTWEVTF